MHTVGKRACNVLRLPELALDPADRLGRPSCIQEVVDQPQFGLEKIEIGEEPELPLKIAPGRSLRIEEGREAESRPELDETEAVFFWRSSR